MHFCIAKTEQMWYYFIGIVIKDTSKNSQPIAIKDKI